MMQGEISGLVFLKILAYFIQMKLVAGLDLYTVYFQQTILANPPPNPLFTANGER